MFLFPDTTLIMSGVFQVYILLSTLSTATIHFPFLFCFISTTIFVLGITRCSFLVPNIVGSFASEKYLESRKKQTGTSVSYLRFEKNTGRKSNSNHTIAILRNTRLKTGWMLTPQQLAGTLVVSVHPPCVVRDLARRNVSATPDRGEFRSWLRELGGRSSESCGLHLTELQLELVPRHYSSSTATVLQLFPKRQVPVVG